MDACAVLVLTLAVFQSCSGFHCPMPTGNYPMIESESCEVYWQCRNGMLVAAQCTGAHQFHYRERKCLHGSIVSCIMQRKHYKHSHMPHKAMPHKPMPMPMPMTPKPAPPKPIYIPFPVPVHPQHPVPPCAAPPCGKPVLVPGSPCGTPPCGKPVAMPGGPGLFPFPQKGQIPPYIEQMWRNVYGRG
ncbi:vegetative cell wall protein gp1-like [Haliotis rubra]|uniref:vegetative cell wall protein gp1-like n=1 Tax=Haliotis rubra TaxID=36100 RepID=UPI001EE5417A|nr:vegetative cell wall protein gp1-like [Haliotis rubra]